MFIELRDGTLFNTDNIYKIKIEKQDGYNSDRLYEYYIVVYFVNGKKEVIRSGMYGYERAHQELIWILMTVSKKELLNIDINKYNQVLDKYDKILDRTNNVEEKRNNETEKND